MIELIFKGFGKAVLPMAEEMAKILDKNMTQCVISVPEGTRETENENIGKLTKCVLTFEFVNIVKVMSLCRGLQRSTEQHP